MCYYGCFGPLDTCEKEFSRFSVIGLFCLNPEQAVFAVAATDVILSLAGAGGLAYYHCTHGLDKDYIIVSGTLLINCIHLLGVGLFTMVVIRRPTLCRMNFAAELHLRAAVLFSIYVLIVVIVWVSRRFCYEKVKFFSYTTVAYSLAIPIYAYFTLVVNGLRVRFLRRLNHQRELENNSMVSGWHGKI